MNEYFLLDNNFLNHLDWYLPHDLFLNYYLNWNLDNNFLNHLDYFFHSYFFDYHFCGWLKGIENF